MDIDVLIERLKKAEENAYSFAKNHLVNNEDKVLDLQKIQLFKGESQSGESIRPFYSEDLKSRGGYFNSIESARSYAEYKQTLTYPVNVPRNADVPNLYVNGRFHSELGVMFAEDFFRIIGETAYAKGIMKKYPSVFGLTEESLSELTPEMRIYVLEQLRKYING